MPANRYSLYLRNFLRSIFTAAATLLVFSCGIVWGQTVTIDASTQYQTLEGWGTTISWWGNDVGGWADPNRTNYVDAVFAPPPTGLGLTYARYNIGGGDCPSCTSTDFPANVPGYQPSNGVYDWTADANQRWVLKRAQADGANLFEAQSNSAPYWMTISGSSTGGVNGADNLASAYYGTGTGTFADYLATVVQHFSTDFGVTFRDVEPFNEPDGSWTYNGNQEGCDFDVADQEAEIQSLGTVLSSRGMITRVAAMDDYSMDNATNAFNNYPSSIQNYLDEINTHSYAGWQRWLLTSAAANAGKRLVVSEWASYDTTGQDISLEIIREMGDQSNALRAVDFTIWQPSWPVMNPDDSTQTFLRYGTYYAYGNFTKYIRPGYQFISMPAQTNSDPNWLAAYNANTNTLAIVTANWTGSDASITYNLANFSSMGTTVSPYRTSAGEQLSQLGSIAISNNSFTATAAANSVTTYVIPNIGYVPPVESLNDTQFTYHGSCSNGTWCYGAQSGAYNGDNHWDDTPGDYYTVSFTGVQARVYASKNNGNGIAAYSVDGGAETDVDLYSPTRTDNVFTYATPTLSNGAHTLKVRVTGLQNVNALYPVVSADRVDVVTSGVVSINDNTQGSGTNQFNYVGDWSYYGSQPNAFGNDNHWSTNSGDYYTVQFTGTGATVYGSRDVWDGHGGFSVDGGAETDVDLYQSSRVDDVPLWTTPTLSYGTHTLKVRVTGNADSGAGADVVPADRVDIMP